MPFFIRSVSFPPSIFSVSFTKSTKTAACNKREMIASKLLRNSVNERTYREIERNGEEKKTSATTSTRTTTTHKIMKFILISSIQRIIKCFIRWMDVSVLHYLYVSYTTRKIFNFIYLLLIAPQSVLIFIVVFNENTKIFLSQLNFCYISSGSQQQQQHPFDVNDQKYYNEADPIKVDKLKEWNWKKKNKIQ